MIGRFAVTHLGFAALLAAGCAHRAATASARRPIDLDLEGVPVHEALRAIARAAHVNIDADPDLAGQVTISVRALPWDAALAAVAAQHGLRVELTGPVVHVSDAATPPAPHPQFSGAPIAVMFDDTPIRTAAKTIADVAGTPIVVDDDVQARVTLHLRRVPWDLALDHLVRKYELHMARETGRNRISKP